MSTQSVNTTTLSATSPVLYPVPSNFRGWENLTSSSPSGTLLKVVAVAVISGLIGFLLGAYWERSRGSNAPKISNDNAPSPVVEPPKTETNPTPSHESHQKENLTAPSTSPAPAETPKIEPFSNGTQQRPPDNNSEGEDLPVADVQSTAASSSAQPATAPAPAEPFKIDWNKLPEGIQKAGIEMIVAKIRKLAKPGSREVQISMPDTNDYFQSYTKYKHPYEFLIKAQIITKYKIDRGLCVTLSEEFFKTL